MASWRITACKLPQVALRICCVPLEHGEAVFVVHEVTDGVGEGHVKSRLGGTNSRHGSTTGNGLGKSSAPV